MINKYFIRYFINTPNSVSGISGIGKNEIKGFDFFSNKDKFIVYDSDSGLIVDGYIYSDSIKDAEKISLIAINNLVKLIDFATSTSSKTPLIDMIYEASPEKKLRIIKKFFYFNSIARNFILINKEILTSVSDKLFKIEDYRIDLALDWLKKGNSEKKIINKFISYWTGLEVLNLLLCDYFNIEEINRKFVCDCGQLINPLKSIGIETLFLNILKINKTEFHEIRRIRGKILHGDCPIDNKMSDIINDIFPTVRKGLVKGLGILLNLNSDIVNKIEKKIPKNYKDKLHLSITTNIINFTPPSLEIMQKQPKIEVLFNKPIEKIDVNKLIVQGSFKIFFKNVENFGEKEITISADKNNSIDKCELS